MGSSEVRPTAGGSAATRLTCPRCGSRNADCHGDVRGTVQGVTWHKHLCNDCGYDGTQPAAVGVGFGVER